jgi:hypothetical protein
MSVVPVFKVEETQAQAAWEAHQALLMAEAGDPGLRANPVWNCLRMDAYEAFYGAFERLR